MNLDEDFGKWNRYEQAAYIYLSNKKFWDKWSNLVIISDCSRRKTCIKYPNLPLKMPTQKKSDLKAMETVAVDFFRLIKGSRSCNIQTYRLGPNYHYFATLQEKPIVLEIDNPEKDKFEPTRVVLPYRFVFSFNEEEGVFSLYGVDGVSDSNTLASLLLKVLIGYNGELLREPKPIYNLSPLKDRSFLFDIDGSDGIEDVIFKSVTVRPIDDPKSQITFCNGEDGVFHCIDRYLDEKELKMENIEFVRAVVLFRMRPEFTAFRQATFDLSLTGDNLSEKTDAQAKLLRKYIRRWKLRLAGEQLNTTMITELIKFSSGEKPIMSYQYREMLPSAVRYGLMEWGFLKRTQNAASIQIGDSAFKVEYFQTASGDDLAPVVIGQNGDVEEIEDEDIERYLVDYSALAVLLHDELECRGQAKMELDNKVWWLGTKGQEGRNIYFVYNNYFYQRHNFFWGSVAINRLSAIFGSTKMLCCAEDLGMLPDCVAPVLDQLRILTLEIQSMPKQSGFEFTHLDGNPYRSVATFSTHDMSPLRLWWEENPERTQRYYVTMLQKQGRAPEHLPAHLAEEIIARHLYCPSMLCILSLQDWLAMDGELRSKHLREERINVPSDAYNRWKYRMHLTIEDLLKADRYNSKVRTMITRSKR